MPPQTTTDIDDVFRALAHPIRRSLLQSLAAGSETIVRLAEPHDVSLNAVSKHVKTLESAGLVARERDGTFHRLTLRPEGMRPAFEWMEYYTDLWRHHLAALKPIMESD